MDKVAILVTHEYFDENSQSVYAQMVQDQFSQLKAALNIYSIDLIPVFWEDSNIDWSQFALVTPLMAWNYPQNLLRFLECLEEIEACGIKIANHIDIIRDNFDKNYLIRLSENGAPVPQTLQFDMRHAQDIPLAFDKFNCDEIIIKPRIGAGAWRQARLKRGEILPDIENLPPDFALVQPFIKSVQSQGELSMLFMGGKLSHSLMKTPKSGDYRSQTKYGAIETPIIAPANALLAAQEILTQYDSQNQLTYARIDMVEAENGNWLLMEMELIEPYLYGPFDGKNGEVSAQNFAIAIKEAMNS